MMPQHCTGWSTLSGAARSYPEFGWFVANPGNKAAQPRMFAQLLDRIVLALQFLLGERRMDRGMTDPVQRDCFPAIAAARYKMMLVDAAARDKLAPAQR